MCFGEPLELVRLSSALADGVKRGEWVTYCLLCVVLLECRLIDPRRFVDDSAKLSSLSDGEAQEKAKAKRVMGEM